MLQLFYFFNALEINCITIPCTRNEVAKDILVLMFLNGPSVSPSVLYLVHYFDVQITDYIILWGIFWNLV